VQNSYACYHSCAAPRGRGWQDEPVQVHPQTAHRPGARQHDRRTKQAQRPFVSVTAPNIERGEDAIARWRDRNVFSIPACQSCPVASVCGGGCGAVAANRTGTVAAPDCRPVRELLGLGARYYRLGDD
jgi:radical SAM protein with 4Fe4S-binding SPASM domain